MKVKVLVAQLGPAICNSMDCSPPFSSLHGILRQESWSGDPFPFPGHLPNPEIKPLSFALQADSLSSKPSGKPTSWDKEK